VAGRRQSADTRHKSAGPITRVLLDAWAEQPDLYLWYAAKEFLELAADARERDLEQAPIADIQKFLLELGTGFAFYGRQKPIDPKRGRSSSRIRATP
jgi:hypothetical protein